MISRPPETWEEAHQVVRRLESMEASSRALQRSVYKGIPQQVAVANTSLQGLTKANKRKMKKQLKTIAGPAQQPQQPYWPQQPGPQANLANFAGGQFMQIYNQNHGYQRQR